jgi:X-linked retinitis pigmentosa GTPase regulator
MPSTPTTPCTSQIPEETTVTVDKSADGKSDLENSKKGLDTESEGESEKEDEEESENEDEEESENEDEEESEKEDEEQSSDESKEESEKESKVSRKIPGNNNTAKRKCEGSSSSPLKRTTTKAAS